MGTSLPHLKLNLDVSAVLSPKRTLVITIIDHHLIVLGLPIGLGHLIVLGHSINKLKSTNIITIGTVNVLQKKGLINQDVTIMLTVTVDLQDSIGMDLLASGTDPQALTTSTGMDAVTALNILGLDVDNQMYKNVPGVDLGKCSGGDLINKDLGLVHLSE
uniref:Uncharacterized protein n=1 Tax=Heliothis virescens TaxID=7102 RepID=A0A2A4JBH5_HELVI